jgi:hypothetical protein
MDIKQDHQELSQTKPYHTKLAQDHPWWTMYMREAFHTIMHVIQMHANLRYKYAYRSWYICNAKCKNAQKESYTYATKELPPPTQETKHTPSFPHKRVKVDWSKDLANISASWFCVGAWIKAILPFSTLSLRKWYLTSIWLVLEWILCNTNGTCAIT